MQSEFAQLDDESNIFKMVGPVLLKQDKTEAVMAVNGRLEFIEKEMLVCPRFGFVTDTDLCHTVSESRRKLRRSRMRPSRSALR